MFIPEAFAKTDQEEVRQMMARVGLAMLVTHGPEGLFASHVPVVEEGSRLFGHLARRNPHRERWGRGEALLIFPGPDAYVSPSWHPSKAEHGREVPTWNYEAVHVYGSLAWFDDPARLRTVVDRLTRKHEAGRAQPWSIADAPSAYIEGLLRGIVGFELSPTRVEAKRKLSQNKKAQDRMAAADALDEAAPALAALMRDASPAGSRHSVPPAGEASR